MCFIEMMLKVNFRKCLFVHSDPKKLTQGRWIRENYVSVHYFLYKTVICTYFFAILIITNVDEALKNGDHFYHWIYLTIWGFWIFVLALVLEYSLVVGRFFDERFGNHHGDDAIKSVPKENSNFMLRFSWYLTVTSQTLAIGITIVYWAFLSDGFSKTIDNFLNINHHLIQVP